MSICIMRGGHQYEKKTLPVLLIIETTLLVLILLAKIFTWWTSGAPTELAQEISPDGEYTVVLKEIGMPRWPFGPDRISVTLYANADEKWPHYRTSFFADVANDGGPAKYEIEWLEDSTKITLSGQEQKDAIYILPFP